VLHRTAGINVQAQLFAAAYLRLQLLLRCLLLLLLF
jgi:hypothetical protein